MGFKGNETSMQIKQVRDSSGRQRFEVWSKRGTYLTWFSCESEAKKWAYDNEPFYVRDSHDPSQGAGQPGPTIPGEMTMTMPDTFYREDDDLYQRETTMATIYETRAVRSEDGGSGVEIERYRTLEEAIVGSLELWPEDHQSDVLIFAMSDDTIDLVATLRHQYPKDPAVATVCVFLDPDRSDVTINEYRCEYVEIFGRVHTNVTRVSE